MTFDLRFYVAMLFRRLPYVLAIVFASTLAGLYIAFTIPETYRAEARLLFENAQIPDELAASTVRSSADEALLAVQQRLLTRANLLTLAERFDVFAANPDLPEDVIVLQMLDRAYIYMPPLMGNTGVVSVSFDAGDPVLSADVTNALVEQILQQSVELRTAASGSTLDFFDQEVKRLTDELAVQNSRILEFEEANRDALPESLSYRRGRQEAQQERLSLIERELAGLRDRRQGLVDLYDRTGRLAASVGVLTPEQTQLETLRQELASAVVVLSPENPRVRALQLQVTALEEAVKEQLGVAGEGTMSSFDLQMADIDGQIDFLIEQKEAIETELNALSASIDKTPSNSIRLGELQGRYENLQVQYDQAVASLAEARMGDRIEVTSRGQRITVIELAVPPTERAEPNRKLITAAGLGAGMLLSIGLVMLLELLNRTIRRPAELVRSLGITPFGTVPYIPTIEELRQKSAARRTATIGVLVAVSALLYILHVAVMPLDTLASTIAAAVGFGPAETVATPEISG